MRLMALLSGLNRRRSSAISFWFICISLSMDDLLRAVLGTEKAVTLIVIEGKEKCNPNRKKATPRGKPLGVDRVRILQKLNAFGRCFKCAKFRQMISAGKHGKILYDHTQEPTPHHTCGTQMHHSTRLCNYHLQPLHGLSPDDYCSKCDHN